MTNITKIGYIIVFVRNMQRALSFYRDAVGLAVRSESEHWTEFELQGATLALHLADGLGPAPAPALDPGAKKGMAQEIVFQGNDPLALRAALLARGVRVAAPKLVHEAGPAHVGVSCLFEDPDGNLLSVYGVVSRAVFEALPEKS